MNQHQQLITKNFGKNNALTPKNKQEILYDSKFIKEYLKGNVASVKPSIQLSSTFTTFLFL